MTTENAMEESAEFEVVRKLSQNQLSVACAVHNILRLSRDVVPADPKPWQHGMNEGLLKHLSNTVEAVWNEAGRTGPAEQGQLLEFIALLQRHEISDPTTGKQARLSCYHDARIWRDVPLLGITIADSIDFYHKAPEEESQFENHISFLAQLLALPANSLPNHPHEDRPFDTSLYSLWTFRLAFEDSDTPRASSRTNLHAACYWLIFSTDYIWANVQLQRSFAEDGHNKGKAGRRKELKRKSSKGFERERWDMWFGILARTRSIEEREDTKILLDRALTEVERVMNQDWRTSTDEQFAE